MMDIKDEMSEKSITQREALAHEIHQAKEAYYRLDYHSSWVSFDEYLANYLCEAGYRPLAWFKEIVGGMKVIDDEELYYAWNRTGVTNLYSHQERGRPIVQAQLQSCKEQLLKEMEK